MGAWGYSALECDEGQEVKERWDIWTGFGNDDKKIIDLFIESWGDAVNYGDSITNNEIIAAAMLCSEKEMSIPVKLKKITIDAINRELEPIELERWEDSKSSKDREKFLYDFLNELALILKIGCPLGRGVCNALFVD